MLQSSYDVNTTTEDNTNTIKHVSKDVFSNMNTFSNY